MSYQENRDTPHKKGVFETRELCSKLFFQLPPELNNDSSINPPQAQILLTRALLEYHSGIAVKRNKLKAIWNGEGEHKEVLDSVQTLPEVATVTVPIDKIAPDGSVTDDFEPLNHVALDSKPVSLKRLQAEWGNRNQSTVRIYKGGAQRELVAERRFQLALPPRSARLVKNALDDCLEELGWTEKATEKDEHAEPF